MVFSIFAELCKQHYCLPLEDFGYPPPRETPYPLAVTSHSSKPLLLSIRQPPIYFLSLKIFDRGAKRIHWGKSNLFIIRCWDYCISRCKRMKLEPYLTYYAKINSKWIKDLSKGSKTIKLLEESIDVNFLPLILGATHCPFNNFLMELRFVWSFVLFWFVLVVWLLAYKHRTLPDSPSSLTLLQLEYSW